MKRRSFTLLEIMLAILILALVGTVISWQIRQLIASHRFQSDATNLCTALQEAQLLAVTHQTDFEVRFYFSRSKGFYQIQTLEPIASGYQKPIPFQQVNSFSLQGKKTQEILLTIFSSGRIEPHSVIGLHRDQLDDDPASSLWIDLQTPLQIKLSHKRPLSVREELPSLPKEPKS